VLALTAAVLAAASTAYLGLAGGATEQTAEGGFGGESAPQDRELLSPVVGAAAIGLLIAVLPLLLRRTRYAQRCTEVAAVLLLTGSLLGAASFGLFLLPSALVMLLAAIAGRRAFATRQLE
jgi:predicted membrane-bound spermidine synthase